MKYNRKKYAALRLDAQLCFPMYALSRLITAEYQPYLNKYHLTYPQYLVLMVLWEESKATINHIANRLFLNTNTITPLLKRMEQNGWLKRKRDPEDERKVNVVLTLKGINFQEEALQIHCQMLKNIEEKSLLSMQEITALKHCLDKMIDCLK